MATPQDLIPQVTQYVKKYMKKHDGSHDFNHIKRVVGISHDIYSEITRSSKSNVLSPNSRITLDLDIITLSALLHDVGDKKYLKEGEDGDTMVLKKLLGLGADEALATRIQNICLGVSYRSETKDLEIVKDLIIKYPELAVVQDADRLDAIGAIGIGRVFTYGGAMIKYGDKKTARGLDESMEMFQDKLFKVEGMMKTEPGKRLAKEKMEVMRKFHYWWNEEIEVEKTGCKALHLDPNE